MQALVFHLPFLYILLMVPVRAANLHWWSTTPCDGRVLNSFRKVIITSSTMAHSTWLPHILQGHTPLCVLYILSFCFSTPAATLCFSEWSTALPLLVVFPSETAWLCPESWSGKLSNLPFLPLYLKPVKLPCLLLAGSIPSSKFPQLLLSCLLVSQIPTLGVWHVSLPELVACACVKWLLFLMSSCLVTLYLVESHVYSCFSN